MGLRPANMVMDLERLGSIHPYRLSFMRLLIRRIMREQWQIRPATWEADENGHGTAIYTVVTPGQTYSFVAFSHDLDPNLRSDRVIAKQWDMTVCLVAGTVDKDRLSQLRYNVPLQEEGRLDSSCIVLSRANRSVRNFEYVVGELAQGRQPSYENMAQVGYLYRTTAVYGSGKFGMAEWQKVRTQYTDFASPFAAEMFTCYMIRHFSLELAQWIARHRLPDSAVRMTPSIGRYFGIGNATGLGMAPFLVTHPLLIDRWIEIRETALARVLDDARPDPGSLDLLEKLAWRAHRHLGEIATNNQPQHELNQTAMSELESLVDVIRSAPPEDWRDLLIRAEECWSLETQELLVSLLTEMYPQLVDELADRLSVDELLALEPRQKLVELRTLIETRYAWALEIDFSTPGSQAVFWYRSAEKLEPRLGLRGQDEGSDREMALGVARSVRGLYDNLCAELEQHPDGSVAGLVLGQPQLRATIIRIQSLARTRYGDIQANLLDREIQPTHLLRCKLSFFGVSKFDPRSRMWVRNTMFQGAPLVSDIGSAFADDWYFPIMPGVDDERPPA